MAPAISPVSRTRVVLSVAYAHGIIEMRVEVRLSFDCKNFKVRVFQIQMKRTLQEPVVSRTVYTELLLYELIQIAAVFREVKRHTRVRSTCHLVNSHPNTENEHSDQDSFAERPSSATRNQASRSQKIYMNASHAPVIWLKTLHMVCITAPLNPSFTTQ